MKILTRLSQRGKAAFVRLLRSISAALHRLFGSWPAAKRVLLIFGLYGVPVLLLQIVFGPEAFTFASTYGLFLFGLLLGMGAERAATVWSDFFALPPLGSFAFWRWYPLEQKRFYAAVCTLAVWWLAAGLGGVL